METTKRVKDSVKLVEHFSVIVPNISGLMMLIFYVCNIFMFVSGCIKRAIM